MIETPKTNKEPHRREQDAHSALNLDADRKPADQTDDDLDFVVTEAHDQPQELVGGLGSSKADDLSIESPADLMEAEASRELGECHLPDPGASTPIGDTGPPTPPPADQPLDPTPDPGSETTPDSIRTPAPEPGLQKLSEERLQEISKQMRQGTAGNDYLSSEEKQQLLESIDEAPAGQVKPPPPQEEPKTGFDNEPIVPPSKQKSRLASDISDSAPDPTPTPAPIDLSGKQPKMSARVRGVAYFAREYIKISGGQELHEGDNLIINNREYMLRHKKVSNRIILAVAAPLAAILIFALGAMLSPDADTGAGRIVGLVLGDDDRPFITGTEIRFPELGTSYQSSGQGFFKTDPLDAGSYKIEFLYEGQVVATDYATVVADRITTITLRPEPPVEPPAGWEKPGQPAARSAKVIPDRSAPQAQAPPPPAKPKATKNTAGSGSQWAKLALEADVEGAKLTVDGSVLGAGNLTYPRLKPGLHQYVVTMDGYEPYRGSVDLRAGRTKTLNVSLTPKPKVEQPTAPPEQQPFDQATKALKRGETAAALAGFNEALNLNPAYTEAYLGRARAHQQNQDSRQAHDDYVRAAETSTLHRNFNQAVASYDKALAINPKSVPVFLGRGNMYLSRGEEIAAIADFDMAVRHDKRSLHGYLGLGQARYNQGYFKKAIKHFKDARSIDSKNPKIHRHLMRCYYRTGDFKQVKKSYQKFGKYASETELQQLQSDPNFAPILRVIGD